MSSIQRQMSDCIPQPSEVVSLRPGIGLWKERDGYHYVDKVLLEWGDLNRMAYEIMRRLNGKTSIADVCANVIRDNRSIAVSYETFLADTLRFVRDLLRTNKIVVGALSQHAMSYWNGGSRFDAMGFRTPGLVYWETTRRCNHKCPFCYNPYNGDNPEEEITVEQGYELIEKFCEEGVQNIIFTGGEPLLARDKVSAWIRRCSELGAKTELFTNGSLLTEETAKELKDIGLSYCRISLHSSNQEEHDQIVGKKGAWLRTTNALRCVIATGIPTAIMMTVGRFNIRSLRDTVEFAIQLGCDGYINGPLCRLGRAEKLRDEFLSPEELLGLLRFNTETTLVYGRRIKLRWGADIDMDDPWREYVTEPLIRQPTAEECHQMTMRHVKNSICGTGVRSLALNARGKYIPCPAMTDLIIGDAFGCSLAQVWKDPALAVFRQKTLEDFEDCSECGLRYTCYGGCRASALQASGKLTGCYTPFRDAYGWLREHSLGEIPTYYSDAEVTKQVRFRETGAYRETVYSEGCGPWVPETTPALAAKYQRQR